LDAPQLLASAPLLQDPFHFWQWLPPHCPLLLDRGRQVKPVLSKMGLNIRWKRSKCGLFWKAVRVTIRSSTIIPCYFISISIKCANNVAKQMCPNLLVDIGVRIWSVFSKTTWHMATNFKILIAPLGLTIGSDSKSCFSHSKKNMKTHLSAR
jgi:hypothetical protein